MVTFVAFIALLSKSCNFREYWAVSAQRTEIPKSKGICLYLLISLTFQVTPPRVLGSHFNWTQGA